MGVKVVFDRCRWCHWLFDHTQEWEDDQEVCEPVGGRDQRDRCKGFFCGHRAGPHQDKEVHDEKGEPPFEHWAVAARADVFITGEISEQTVHVAREEGIAFIAAGHHATERYGVQAVGEALAQQFSLQHQFFDEDNPV